MSGKREKSDATKARPGSRMLRKARSFKEDIKAKVIRRTPSLGRSPSPSPHKSPKHKRHGLNRGSSFNEEGHSGNMLQEEEDVDRLEVESRKVFQALQYMEDAVNKKILQLLPGAATIVLETIMEVDQLLSRYFTNQDSTVLVSTTKQVYQSLAALLRWADQVLLRGSEDVNKENAHIVIKCVHDGVQELLQLSKEKNKMQVTSPNCGPTKPTSINTTSNSDGSHRTSLPEIPLTPRERRLLEEARGLSGCGNNGLVQGGFGTISRSSDSLLDAAGGHYPTGLPPPKPPLPNNFHSLLSSRKSPQGGSPGPGEESSLPAQARHSMVSAYDNAPVGPPDAVHPARGTLSAQSSVGAPTPLSQSPTSSACSSFSASSEDLLADRSSDRVSDRVSRASSLVSPAGGAEVRLSQYDNCPLDLAHRRQQFDTITSQIRSLTSSTAEPDDGPGGPASGLGSPGVPAGGGPGLPAGDPGGPGSLETPPPLPDKKKAHPRLRVVSHYDNVAVVMRAKPGADGLRMSQSASSGLTGRAATMLSTTHSGASQDTFSSSETFSSSGTYSSSMESLQKPPPLPPKKKHVQTYMTILKDYEEPAVSDQARHSVHSINYYQEQWYSHQLELFYPLCARSNTVSVMSDISSRCSDMYSVTSASSSEDGQGAPPSASSSSSSQALTLPQPPALPPKAKGSPPRNVTPERENAVPETPVTAGNERTAAREAGRDTPPHKRCSDVDTSSETSSDQRPLSTGSSSTRQSSPPPEIQKDGDSDFAELSTLDDIDVSDQLVRKKKGEEGFEIRGGSIDALIVHATIGNFMYQEAFLTTYRTFLMPQKLIDKLLYRYRRFARINDTKKKKLSRNAFSLLVRVVDELCTEISEDILQALMDLEGQLVCEGELTLAKILRRKMLEKCELRQRLAEARLHSTLLPSHQMTAKQYSLTEFKSEHIAEQMTLMDAELFQKIEIPEVLLFSREQNEERSPNLTKFTEHFNKMSYWCRTRILEQEDSRERERYLIKMIKIMKYLRKLNNFNSYLAVLAALDSAPVRRLEWPRQSLEVLRDFCQLIDSSSSFRAYRHALSDTEPPCIPYIGLVLQDLTFIHIGNPDNFQDGNINFAKRWQQFNILDNMRRFGKCNYTFRRHPKIVAYINNFDYYLSDESLWQISENIKPRGGRHKVES